MSRSIILYENWHAPLLFRPALCIFHVSIELCLYFSTHKIIYLYFNIGQTTTASGGKHHLQYIYHGFVPWSSLSLKRKSGIFFGGGGRADTLSVCAKFNNKRSLPLLPSQKMLNSNKAAFFGFDFGMKRCPSEDNCVIYNCFICVIVRFLFFWLFGKQDEQTFLPQLPFFAAVDERNVNRAAKEVIISRFGLDFSRQGVMSFGPKSQFVTRWINVITLVLRINLFPTQNRWNMESLASMYVEIYAQRTDPSRKKIVTFK